MTANAPEIQEAIEKLQLAVTRVEGEVAELDATRKARKKQLTELRKSLRALTGESAPTRKKKDDAQLDIGVDTGADVDVDAQADADADDSLIDRVKKIGRKAG